MNKPITPEALATHFLQQYKIHLEGEQVTQVYTTLQLSSMVAAMKTHPDNMLVFFVKTSEFIKIGMKINNSDENSIIEAIREFYTSILGFIVPFIQIQENKINDLHKDLNPEMWENQNLDVWENLDFPMKPIAES